MTPQRFAIVPIVLLLIAGCGSPPAASPPAPVAERSAPAPSRAAPMPPAPEVTAAPPVVVIPAARPEAPAATIEEKNAADLAALKSALERGVPGAARAASEAPDTRRPEVPAPTAALSEAEAAAVREALQERVQQAIPRHFDAETFRRLLTTHPEFRKD